MTNAISRQRRSIVGAAMIAIAGGTRLGALGTAAARAATAPGHPGTSRDFPSLAGATAWLNSRPLTPAALRGRVVLVNFCTYSCINWLRSLPYVRAWAEKYQSQGLVVMGVHTPEFGFEHDLGNIRRALRGMRIGYPVAVDNNYAVWRAFDNSYWPALYFIDARGRIRHRKFGEGDYAQSERLIQRLLADAGATGLDRQLADVNSTGVEAQADWNNLKSPETYVGYGQARPGEFASPGGQLPDLPKVYAAPSALPLNQWALAGNWTMGVQATVANAGSGRIACCFHARDLNLVLGAPGGRAMPFRVLVDGRPPANSHGIDVNELGFGSVSVPRLYQLIRQPPPIMDRQFTIEFADPGVQAFVFTFG
jgi:hypothetical protein